VAARRLVVVMLVLLAISTLAAALVPAPKNSERTETGTTERKAGQKRNAPAADGELLDGRIDARAGRPKELRIERGDQLSLAVSAPFGDDVEIPGFGLVETVDRFAPANFDLFATRTGTFPVRAVAADRVLGWIVIGARGSGRCGVSTPRALPEQEPDRSCGRRGAPGPGDGDRSDRRP
jgi:hypothetical protein